MSIKDLNKNNDKKKNLLLSGEQVYFRGFLCEIDLNKNKKKKKNE